MTHLPSDVEIRTARSLNEIEALREAWQAWPSHRDSDIDFYRMIVGSYPQVVRPHVLALYRNGQPETILVGRLENKKLAFGVGYLRIFRLSARCLTFVYGAIHGNASSENIEILLREVVSSLKQNEADVAMLEFVPLDSPLYHLALKLPGLLTRDTLPAKQGHEVMEVAGSIDEVYRRMSADRRIETRRRIRKLRGHPAGAPKVICYKSESELGRLFHDAEAIASKTYQRGLGAGFVDDFLVRQRLGLAARKGWLRANLLYLGDRPVAFWIGMLYGATFVSEYMAYDPEFRKWAPGMVLIIQVIEGFCSRSSGDVVKELDFGLGHAEYKAALCTGSWSEASVFIFSPSLRGVLLKSVRMTTRLLDISARRLLSSTTFFAKLKKAWRNRLARRTKSEVAHVPQPVPDTQSS